MRVNWLHFWLPMTGSEQIQMDNPWSLGKCKKKSDEEGVGLANGSVLVGLMILGKSQQGWNILPHIVVISLASSAFTEGSV